MALSDLKPILKVKEPKEDTGHYNAEDLANQILETVRFAGKTLYFDYKGTLVTVRGIEEDFKVYLNNKVVFECVYDTIYNIDHKLLLEILT
jgi:hypothetical protein